MAANPGEIVKPHARASSKLPVANVAAQAMTKGSRTNVTAIKMHSAEMTATTKVATTTEVATATEAAATVAAAATTAAACKDVGRETQPAQGDTRQQYSCQIGHHDSLRRTARVYALDRTSESMAVLGSDLRWIAVLDTSLRDNADENLFSLTRRAYVGEQRPRAELVSGSIFFALPRNWRQSPAELGNSRKAAAGNWAYTFTRWKR